MAGLDLGQIIAGGSLLLGGTPASTSTDINPNVKSVNDAIDDLGKSFVTGMIILTVGLIVMASVRRKQHG